VACSLLKSENCLEDSFTISSLPMLCRAISAFLAKPSKVALFDRVPSVIEVECLFVQESDIFQLQPVRKYVFPYLSNARFLRPSVPGAYVVADITSKYHVVHPIRNRFRDRASILDGVIRDAQV